MVSCGQFRVRNVENYPALSRLSRCKQPKISWSGGSDKPYELVPRELRLEFKFKELDISVSTNWIYVFCTGSMFFILVLWFLLRHSAINFYLFFK